MAAPGRRTGGDVKIRLRHQVGCCALVVTMAVVVGTATSAAYGQQSLGRARRGSESLGNTLRKTSYVGLFGGSTARSYGSGGVATGGYMAPATAAASAMFGGRPRSRDAVQSEGTKYLGPGYSTPMMTYFGRSRDAFWFAPPVFSGRGRTTLPLLPTFRDPEMRAMVLDPQLLALYGSYHHRALLPLEGGRIRDEMTTKSLENPIPIPEDVDSPTRQRLTHAEQLQARIEASRSRYLEQGWSYLRQSDYLRSKNAFESAALIGPSDLAPRVGQFLCAIADRQFSTASVFLAGLVEHHEDMFSVRYPFTDVFADAQVGEAVLTGCAAAVEHRPDSDAIAALHVYALWLDGQQAATLTAASKLREGFRASRFACFADMIHEQMRSEETDSKAPPGPQG